MKTLMPRSSLCTSAMAILLMAAARTAFAATWTVTNTQDSGAGSLRYEIAAAQSGDTIVFSSTLNGGTISLTSGELLLTKNLAIQGPGADKLWISGTTQIRQGHGKKTTITTYRSLVFEVAQNTTVTLGGLTITNGYGGGILNHGTLTLSGCTVSNSFGSGIFNDGTATLRACTVSGNFSALEGGGIFNGGALTLDGCTVFNNIVLYVGGGGIFNDGTMTVKNSSNITGNYLDDPSYYEGEADYYIPDDAENDGTLYLDSTSKIGILVGYPAIPF